MITEKEQGPPPVPTPVIAHPVISPEASMEKPLHLAKETYQTVQAHKSPLISQIINTHQLIINKKYEQVLTSRRESQTRQDAQLHAQLGRITPNNIIAASSTSQHTGLTSRHGSRRKLSINKSIDSKATNTKMNRRHKSESSQDLLIEDACGRVTPRSEGNNHGRLS